MKECSKCSLLLPILDFYSYEERCKECVKAYTRLRHANMTSKNRINYNTKRREKWQNTSLSKKQEKIQKDSITRKVRKTTMTQEELQIFKAKKLKNYNDMITRLSSDELIKRRETRNVRMRMRYSNEIDFRLKAILRARLNGAIKDNHKSGSAVRDLGCSIEDLKKHLESQFQEGMNWSNYGSWHIDHIIPLAAFDLSNPNELKSACHYSNLQPLWAKDNLLKIADDLDYISRGI
jgi:hypothetical protein